MGHAKVAGFQRDEVYVGTPEERAAGQKPDHSVHPGREFTMGTAITAPVGASGNAPAGAQDALLRLANKETFTVRRERIVNNIKELRELAAEASTDAERQAYEQGAEMEVRALDALNEEETAEGVEPKEVPVKDVELGSA